MVYLSWVSLYRWLCIFSGGGEKWFQVSLWPILCTTLCTSLSIILCSVLCISFIIVCPTQHSTSFFCSCYFAVKDCNYDNDHKTTRPDVLSQTSLLKNPFFVYTYKLIKQKTTRIWHFEIFQVSVCIFWVSTLTG